VVDEEKVIKESSSDANSCIHHKEHSTLTVHMILDSSSQRTHVTEGLAKDPFHLNLNPHEKPAESSTINMLIANDCYFD